jgi:hypothetical protein
MTRIAPFLRWNERHHFTFATDPGFKLRSFVSIPKGSAEPTGHVLVLFARMGAAGQ